MKRIIFAIFIAVLITGSCSRSEKPGASANVTEETGSGAEIQFEKTVNELGEVKQGEKVIAWFDYHNKGEAPLVINEIKAGCGCTVPTWDKAPLQPGKGESIKIIFDSSGKKGVQKIRITVHSNANTPVQELNILARVVS